MSPKIEECSRPNEVRSVSPPERDGSAATSSAEAQLRVALAENTRLALALQTMRHSVGNQLALLSAMLARQARAGGEPAIQHALKAAQRRVHVVAETLRLEGHGEDGELVGSKLLVERTAEGLSELAARAEIKIEVDVQDVALQRDEAVSFMLIINELVVNSLRHAFPHNMTGEILVRLTHASDAAGEVLALIVEDNGVGRSADDKDVGLGTTVVLAAVQSLGAKLVEERRLAADGRRGLRTTILKPHQPTLGR
jgi:two-component sensor histidine kinase